MTEDEARQVELVRAIELEDREGLLFTREDRDQADTRARAEVGGGTGRRADSRFVAARAGFAATRLATRHPGIAGLLEKGGWTRWLAILLPLVALAAGLLANEFGTARRLDLLAVPLLAAMGDPTPPPGPVQLPRVETPAAPVTPAPEPAALPALPVQTAAEIGRAFLLETARPLVVFADSPADPSFRAQLAMLEDRPAGLIERDVVVITDSDPAARSEWRTWLRPEGFSLVLIDKDGQVKQRKPIIWDTREIARAIDKFPSRRAEIGRAGFAQ